MPEPNADPVGEALRRGGTVARRFITDFRDFILRGNIVDLAVGVVIGVAFNGLVTRFTEDFIQPLIKLAGGGGVFSGSFKVASQRFLWADFVNAIISFVITAAVVFFFVVKPMNMLAARRAAGQEPEAEAVPTLDQQLLMEIRDSLRAQQS